MPRVSVCFLRLQEKDTPSKIMHYRKGPRDAQKDTSQPRVNNKQRALTLEQEFLVFMMKLKMGLFLFDLAFRFAVSKSTLHSHCFELVVKVKKLKGRCFFHVISSMIFPLPKLVFFDSHLTVLLKCKSLHLVLFLARRVSFLSRCVSFLCRITEALSVGVNYSQQACVHMKSNC